MSDADGSARPAELGGKIIRLNAEFLGRIDGRQIADPIEQDRIDRSAVYQDSIGSSHSAIGLEVAPSLEIHGRGIVSEAGLSIHARR